MNVFPPAPEFDGKAANFAPPRQEVELRPLATHLPLNRRAPALALAMDKMPREPCLALGVDVLKSDVGADEIMETLQQNTSRPMRRMRHIAVLFRFRDYVGPILHWMNTCPVSRWLVVGRRRESLMVEYFREFFVIVAPT